MPSPFISFRANGSDASTARVLAGYTRLQRARVFRQLLVKRLTLLTIGVGIFAQWIHFLTHVQLGLALGILLLPAVLAFLMEQNARSRLTRDLTSVRATAAEDLSNHIKSP